MAVDPEVAKLFSRQLKIWREALRRWTAKCQGAQEEHKKSRGRRALVSERARIVSAKFDPGAKISDAPPPLLTGTKDADREAAIEKRAKGCDEILDQIRKTIEILNHARNSGEFQSLVHRNIALRKQPKFITSIDRKHEISRGDRVEVKALKGDWMQVKTADAEGWLHKSDLMPRLPIEGDMSTPRVKGREQHESDQETGVRDTVGTF